MAIKLIKHGQQEEKKKEQPVAGPDQLRLTAQSWVNEFKARKRNGLTLASGEQERLQSPPLKRAA